MRALVVFCHPRDDSFTAAVLATVRARLDAAGAEIRVRDLYREGFQPLLTGPEWAGYMDSPGNVAPVAREVADLRWCDTLVFVYPTWWYGLPAMLKGWLDRVMLPEVAFALDPRGDIRPKLRHIGRLGIFTTCGASWWLTRFIGAPGRRTLARGLGLLLGRPLRTVFAAHYRMDVSTPASRARHLARVARKVDRLAGARRVWPLAAAA